MQLLGTPVMRVGDPRLLTGTATYVGNLELPGMLEAHFVLSTMAHARVTRVDVESARQVPGVIDIVTMSDLEIGPMPTRLSGTESMCQTLLGPWV
jgi:carbon-monoxide dehydrogenase large subunit